MDLLKDYKPILEEDIGPICEPLKQFGIEFFHYVRRYKNNSRIALSNRPDWIEFLYSNKLFLAGNLEWKQEYYKTSYFLWSTIENQNIYTEAREFYNIDHGITIIKKLHDDSIEFVHFGGKRQDRHIVNFFLTNIDFLNRFILYFKERAAKLLQKAERQPILVPWSEPGVSTNDLKIILSGSLSSKNTGYSDLLAKTHIKRYQLGTKNGLVHLTARELDCLLGILDGKTSQEMAQELYRSKRTVEAHISNVKQKLGCSTKADLIKFLVEKGFSFHDKIWRIFL